MTIELHWRNIYWNTKYKHIYKSDELYKTSKTARKHISKHRHLHNLLYLGAELIYDNMVGRNTVILFQPYPDIYHQNLYSHKPAKQTP